MSKTAFTPGPWRIPEKVFKEKNIFEGKSYPLFRCAIEPGIIGSSFKGDVCMLQSSEHIDGIAVKETEANAHLIASSPELYEALEAAVDSLVFAYREIKHAGIAPEEDVAMLHSRVILARAALAKARGEQ